MNKRRQQRQYSDLTVLGHLISVMREPLENQSRWETDLIGVARQYGGYLIPRERYAEVLQKPLEQIIEQHNGFVSDYMKIDKSFQRTVERHLYEDEPEQ